MSIRPFLEGEFFDPELVEAMSMALVEVCRALRIEPSDAAAQVLAKRIIEQARAGVHDSELLKAAVLKDFRSRPKN